RFHAQHRVEIGIGKHHAHVFLFFTSNSVFAAQRSADVNADFQNFFAHREDPVDLVGPAAIEKNQGVKVPVTSVEDIGDRQFVASGNTIDFRQHFGQTRAGNHGVH